MQLLLQMSKNITADKADTNKLRKSGFYLQKMGKLKRYMIQEPGKK